MTRDEYERRWRGARRRSRPAISPTSSATSRTAAACIDCSARWSPTGWSPLRSQEKDSGRPSTVSS